MTDPVEAAIELANSHSEKDWDPKDGERCWMSHSLTGEKGWIVKRNGRIHVRFNHGDWETTRAYNATQWIADKQHRHFNRQQIVKVAFEADRELCMLLGERKLAMRTWNKLTDAQRRSWMDKGPKRLKVREELYKMIVNHLEKVTQVV